MIDYTECNISSLPTHSVPTLPRVTFALFAYKQESHVRSAVAAALAQCYHGPLEIILSDDGSPDQTFAVMQEVASEYRGPHHVRLNQNKYNLGLSAHVNLVMSMADGEIIVIAAGDDIAYPCRVKDTVEILSRHPGAMAVSFTDICIDEKDEVIQIPSPKYSERTVNLETFLSAGARAQSLLQLSGASRAYRRSVYTHFGDLLPDCPAEDSPYLLRSLYLGYLVVSGKPGIRYRVHPSQLSSVDSICLMDSSRFLAQYRQDLHCALAEYLFDRSRASDIELYFQKKQADFAIRRFRNGNLPSGTVELIKILLLLHYPLRLKLRLLRTLFCG